MTARTPGAVLLVDGDPVSRTLLEQMLIRAGYNVEAHPDYRGALAVLESEMQLECMVTALALPKGTPHGVALGNMALVKRPHLHLFFIAANAEEASWVDDRWIDSILMQPVDGQRLVAAIEHKRGRSSSRLNSP